MLTLFTSLDALQRTTDVAEESAGWPAGYEGKRALHDAGSRVRALRYQRASQDQHGERYSVTSQDLMNCETVARYSWTDAGTFTDNNQSASRHAAKKERPEYELLLDAIRSGAGDVLVIVELPRAQRDLAVYVKIRDLCLVSGLHFWCIGGALFDLRDRNDRQSLGMQAVQAEGQSDAIKEGTLRGLMLQAQQGRPHGATLYGYVRSYKPASGKLAEQVFDEEEHTDAMGRTWTAAGIVREIFARYLASEAVLSITNDLHARGIPIPRLHAAVRIGHTQRVEKWSSRRWRDTTVKHILTNPGYIGKRMHRGRLTADGQWPALIEEKQFFAVARRLAASTARGERVTGVRWLFSCIAKCGTCGGEMIRNPPTKGVGKDTYRCREHACCSVPLPAFEEYVLGWLMDELRRMAADGFRSGVSAADVDEASRQRKRALTELEAVREAFLDPARPWVDQAVLDTKSAQAHLAIAKAEEVLLAGLPPVIRELVGPDPFVKWAVLSLAQRRDVLRAVADIKVIPAGRGRRNVPITVRVALRNRLCR